MKINEVEILKRIPFFNNLEDVIINGLHDILEEEKYPTNYIIIKEGEISKSLYIIKSGKVEVAKEIDGNKNNFICILGPEEFFGEMSLIEHMPRMATIRTLSETVVLKINKLSFDKLVEKNPRVYKEIANTLSERLREVHVSMIENLRKKNSDLELTLTKLKEYQSKLIENEKYAAIGNVSNQIMHDIKNLLTTVSGYAQIIEKKNPENSKYTKIIINNINLIVEMTQEILNFSRGEDVKLKINKTNVKNFIEELCDLFKNSYQRIVIKSEVLFNGDAEFDPNALKRVVHNLVKNAIDAISDKEDGEIIVKTEDNGASWILSIKDNGNGIPDSVKNKLFKPFATFGKKNGTGLGLTICKNIVENHNGSISLLSEERKGTEFKIIIPKEQKKI